MFGITVPTDENAELRFSLDFAEATWELFFPIVSIHGTAVTFKGTTLVGQGQLHASFPISLYEPKQ